MAPTLTLAHDAEAELEPLPPQGFADFDPRPRHEPPEQFRLTPGWLALVAVVLAAGGVFAAYRASAINAIRALESDRAAAHILNKQREVVANRLLAASVSQADVAAAAKANRALLHEQRQRYFDIADHVNGVSSFDGNVRRLREALVSALLKDAHDLDHAARAPIPDTAPRLSGDYEEVDRLLAASQRRWSIRPAPPPVPKPLSGADETLARFEQWVDAPTGGVSLLVLRDETLRLLHLDTATDTLLGRARFTNVAPAGSFIAVASLEGVDFIDVEGGLDGGLDGGLEGGPDRRRIVEGGDRPPPRVVRAAEPDTVWLQREWEWGTPVTRIDSRGAVVEIAPSRGVLQAAVGNRLLWYSRDADGPARYTLSERDGTVVQLYEDREFLDASPSGVAWRIDGQRLAVTDAAGHDLALEVDEHHLYLRDAAWSRDGSRLAVAHGDGLLQIVDLGSRTTTARVFTQGAADLAWLGNDRVFFVAGTSFSTYRVGEEKAVPMRLRRTEGRLLAAL